MQACNLSATDLACRRGDRVLFRGFNVSMREGDALHITGSNGIGKSSLMRILAGLLLPFDGSVARVGAAGLLDERPALDPQVALGDALAFWTGVDSSHELADTAHILGLENLLDVPFRFLSTGQKKRSAFARLLNQNAPIWLLDEPLNGLDNDAKEQVESLINLHCKGGGICITASHQPISLPADAKRISLEDFAL